MFKKVLRGATALGFAFTAVAPALAQDGGDNDVIMVWGNRLEQRLPFDLDDYGSRVEVISADQIDEGGYIDTTAVLQTLVPGLYLTPKNGAFDYVNLSLRGSRTKDVLWLVDGVRVSNRLYDTTTPLDTIPAHAVERIEVLKGGHSLFYGTQAVAGAINIVTRDFSDTTDAEFSGGIDTNDGTHVSGFARGAAGPHRFVFYASADEADGFQPFRSEDYQPSQTDRERGYDVTTLGGKYAIELSPELIFSASVQHTDATVDFATAADRASSFNTRDEEIVWGKLDWTPNERFALFAKVYWHDWDSTFTRIDNVLDAMGQPSGDLSMISNAANWGFEDYGVNLLSEFELNDATTLLFGYDHQSYEGLDEEFLIAEQSESVDAVFAQARFDLDILEGARLAAGARYNQPSDSQEKTVWNLSGEVDLSDNLFARGQVGTSFRLPTAYELYVVDPCCEQGNPNLVGEESFNVELGVGGVFGLVSWEAMAFHRNIEDLIFIDFDNPAFPDGVLANSNDEVEVNGFEFVATAPLGDDAQITFDYTHTESETNSNGAQLDDIPEDIAKLILNWDPSGRRFGASASVNYVGDVTDTFSTGLPGARMSVTQNHGDYATLDLAGYVYLDDDERHRLGLRVENVFDEDYVTQIRTADRDADSFRYGVDALGTPLTATLSYTFKY